MLCRFCWPKTEAHRPGNRWLLRESVKKPMRNVYYGQHTISVCCGGLRGTPARSPFPGGEDKMGTQQMRRQTGPANTKSPGRHKYFGTRNSVPPQSYTHPPVSACLALPSLTLGPPVLLRNSDISPAKTSLLGLPQGRLSPGAMFCRVAHTGHRVLWEDTGLAPSSSHDG
jgi:hypothetical protein